LYSVPSITPRNKFASVVVLALEIRLTSAVSGNRKYGKNAEGTIIERCIDRVCLQLYTQVDDAGCVHSHHPSSEAELGERDESCCCRPRYLDLSRGSVEGGNRHSGGCSRPSESTNHNDKQDNSCVFFLFFVLWCCFLCRIFCLTVRLELGVRLTSHSRIEISPTVAKHLIQKHPINLAPFTLTQHINRIIFVSITETIQI
jgi:hypothetical protein